MTDVWYRGEGVGVPPAKIGGVDHDLSDGMYFSNDIEVAKRYASERAPTVADRRVYSVKVDTGSLRILDLTTDPRWKKHVSLPIPPQDSTSGWTTIEAQLKTGTASQYAKHFDNFVNNPKNGINLKNYDAVIGYEYRNGGKQMCVLYKEGQPAHLQLQAKLRATFVPVGALASTSPPGQLRLGGKIGPGLKFVGGNVVSILVSTLLAWLIGKAKKDDLEKQLQDHRATIETDIRKDKSRALALLASNKKAYATVQLRIMTTAGTDSGPHGAGGTIDTDPVLTYLGIDISDTKYDKVVDTEFVEFPGGLQMTRSYYNASVPLEFSQQEVDLYRAYLQELQWYDAQIVSAPSAEDEQRLSKDRNDLVARLNAAMAD